MKSSDSSSAQLNEFPGWAIRLATACTVLMLAPVSASAADGWLMHGEGIENNAHADSDINKNNIDKVTLKSIYNIDTTTAGGKTRGENAVGSGIAVTNGGIADAPMAAAQEPGSKIRKCCFSMKS